MIDLAELRDTLPAGPEQLSNLDRVVDQMTASTNSNGLHERSVRWGWISPSGNVFPWTHWQRRAAWQG